MKTVLFAAMIALASPAAAQMHGHSTDENGNLVHDMRGMPGLQGRNAEPHESECRPTSESGFCDKSCVFEPAADRT